MHDKSMLSNVAGSREASYHYRIVACQDGDRICLEELRSTDKRLYCGGITAKTMHATAFGQTSTQAVDMTIGEGSPEEGCTTRKCGLDEPCEGGKGVEGLEVHLIGRSTYHSTLTLSVRKRTNAQAHLLS